MRRDWSEGASLYSPGGARKYLNRAERQRVLAAMAKLPADQALFALTLAWTGARVSEVLNLTASAIQMESGVVALRTLKRRKHHVREVPIPPELVAALDRHFRLSAMQRDPQGADSRLWPWHRATAWRVIKRVMTLCSIAGRQACPRGLRHSFGVGAIQAGILLSLVQKLMGHARLSTTAIYTDLCNFDERVQVAKFWCHEGDP